jgi:excinuclease ABC subunit C
LGEIPGVGPARQTALLEHFGSLRALTAASPEEIANVPGVGPALARTIVEHLNPETALDGANPDA